MSNPNRGHFAKGKHRAPTDMPEPTCTCGASHHCALSDHTINCAITIDLYARGVLSTGRLRWCANCAIWAGFGAVSIYRAPQEKERDSDWLRSHCWSCWEPIDNLCPECGRYYTAPFGHTDARLCEDGDPNAI